MKKFISLVLICSIVMGIILYGSNYTYDFKTHMQAISEIGEFLPSLDAVVDIWDDDEYYPKTHGLPYVWPYYGYNIDLEILPDDPNAYLQIDPDGDWGVLDVVREFFNGGLLIIQQIMYTASFLVYYLFGVLRVVVKLSPTAGIVERTA